MEATNSGAAPARAESHESSSIGPQAPEENLRRVFFFWMVFSAALLWLGPFANYSSPGSMDPWLYTGYFTNFHDLVSRYGLRYYPARLPYVLFGVLMYKVFSPLAANYLINVAILAADTFSLYAIVVRHAGRWVAAVTTIALACNPYLISTIASDYPDGPAIAFLLLGFWMALAPPRRWEGNAAIVGAGAFWAMAGYTNLIAGLIILPGVVVLLSMKPTGLREAMKRCTWLAAGVVLVTLVFGVISLFIFHKFAFWMAQWNMYRAMTANREYLSQMWGSGADWIVTSHRMAALYGLTLVGLVFFGRYFSLLRKNRFFVSALLLLVLSDLIFAYEEFVARAVVLRVFYTSSYLLAPVFIFLGALLSALSTVANGAGKPWQRIFVGMALAGVVLPLFAVRFLLDWQKLWVKQWVVLLVIGLVGLAAACVPAALRRFGRVLAAFCFALLLSFSTSLNMAYVFFNNRIEFKAAIATQDLLMSGLVKGRPLLFWYDDDERWSPLFHSIQMFYVWDYRDFTHRLETMPVEELRSIVPPGTVIIHLTTMPAKLPERTRLLATRNLRVEEIGHWTVEREPIEFQIYAQHVLNASELR